MAHRILSIIVLLASLAFVSPVLAQDTCDLSRAIELLTRAEVYTTAGDTEGALDAIDEAREMLESLDDVCSSDLRGDDTGEFVLSETYTLETDAGALTFSYPEGWYTGDLEDNLIGIGNTQSAIETDFSSPDVPAFESGEVLLIAGLVNADFFGLSDLDTDATALDLLSALVKTMDDGESTIPEAFYLNDRASAHATIAMENAELYFVLVDLGEGVRSRTFALLLILSTPGESSDYHALVEQVARSLDFEA